MADLVAEIAVSEAKFRQQTRKVFDDALRATADFERQANAKLKDFGKGFANSEMTKAQAREFDRLKKQFDPLYAASKRYEGQLARLNQAQKMGALSTKQYEAALETLNAEFSGAAPEMQRAGGASRSFGHQIQNTSYQVQDFAVQVAGGTSASKAFAQQLPQLLGGFGVWGAVAGAAVAIGVPLAAMFLRNKEEVLDLDEQLERLEASTDAMSRAAEAAATPIDELRVKYGELADEVQRASGAMLDITTAQARQDAFSTARSLGTNLGEGLPSINAFIGPDGQVMRGYEAARAKLVEQAVEALGKKFGVARGEALAFIDAMRDFGRVDDVNTLAEQSSELLTVLGAVGDVTDDQRRAVTAAAQQIEVVQAAAAKQAESRNAAERARVDDLLDTYDKTTRTLKKHASDLETAEAERAKAAAAGLDDEVKQWDRVIAKIREMIYETRAAGAETDTLFERLVRGANRFSSRVDEFMGAALGRGVSQNAMTIGREYAGKHERFNRDELKNLIGVDPATVAWCAAFMNAVLDRAGSKGTGSLAARSYLDWGTATDSPVRGDVVVLKRGNSSTAGHVGFYEGINPDGTIRVFGGNQGDRVGTSNFRADDVLGYRRAPAPDRYVDPEAAIEAERIAVAAERAQAAEKKTAEALKEETKERERKAELVRQYSESLSRDLVTEQQRAELERQRAEAVAAINASNLSESDKAAAIAEANGEMQKQLTIMALMEEANRRGVDLNAQMVNSTMTYAQAIEALGEAKKQSVITDQQVAASAANAAEAQKFWADQQRALEDGLIDAIVAGENFADVLANVAQALAKAALQAALFGSGPFGNGSGLLSGLFSFGGGDPLTSALRGAGVSFDGGGFTGHGPRSGGIDGKGGFPAILHPNETVIDHTRGQRAGANVNYSPSINISGDASERTVALIDAALERERSAFFSRWARAQREYSTRIA